MFPFGIVVVDGNFDTDSIPGDVVLRNYNAGNSIRLAIGEGNSPSQYVFNSDSLTLNLGAVINGNVNGSSTTFTGNLSGIVTGPMNSTTIGNNQITNSMLQTLTTAGLVANSSTTASTTATANSIVQRDSSGNITTNEIGCSIVNSEGISIDNSGTNGSCLSVLVGSSDTGSLFGYPSNDVLNLAYNYYCPYTNSSPVIPNSSKGTSNIQLGNSFVQFGAGASNTAPTYYLRIGSGGKIAAQNSGYFDGNGELTLTNSTINDTTNTVMSDMVRVLTATSYVSQSLSISGSYVNLTGYSLSTASRLYYIIYSLNIQIPASYVGQITIQLTTNSLVTTNTQYYSNSSTSPTTICICSTGSQSTASASTVYLSWQQNTTNTITLVSGYMQAVPYG